MLRRTNMYRTSVQGALKVINTNILSINDTENEDGMDAKKCSIEIHERLPSFKFKMKYAHR